MTRPQQARRRKAPSTNPELAVRRAESGRNLETEPMPTVSAPPDPPAVRMRPDDPPIFREVWNELYGLPVGTS